MNKKNTRASLAYPRALVHRNGGGLWACAWRMHPDTGNHWDEAMDLPHYHPALLAAACDGARARVGHMWDLLGRGDGA